MSKVGIYHLPWRMIRKRFTDKSHWRLALKRLGVTFALAVGTTSTAWGRFGSGLLYQSKRGAC